MVNHGYKACSESSEEFADTEMIDDARRNARRQLAGSLSGVFPVDYVDRMRDEWPA